MGRFPGPRRICHRPFGKRARTHAPRSRAANGSFFRPPASSASSLIRIIICTRILSSIARSWKRWDCNSKAGFGLGKPCAYRSPAFSPLWSILNWTYLERRRRLSSWRTTDTLWGVRSHLNASEVRAIIDTLPDGFHEFLFHPRTRSCPDTLCLLQLRSDLVPS